MNWLNSVFGYTVAVRIKDLGDAFIVAVIAIYLKEWLIDGPFYKNVDLDPEQDKKMAIVIVEGTSNQYTINPRTNHGYVENKIAWIVARLTGKASLNYKDLETIRSSSRIILAVLLFVAVLFTVYEYLPPK
jgi:hypothetical protein